MSFFLKQNPNRYKPSAQAETEAKAAVKTVAEAMGFTVSLGTIDYSKAVNAHKAIYDAKLLAKRFRSGASMGLRKDLFTLASSLNITLT